MIYLTNSRFLTLWKSLRLEVADSGLAQVDTTWNMVNVCSPYSRLYLSLIHILTEAPFPSAEGTWPSAGKRSWPIYAEPGWALFSSSPRY